MNLESKILNQNISKVQRHMKKIINHDYMRFIQSIQYLKNNQCNLLYLQAKEEKSHDHVNQSEKGIL